MAKDCGHHEDLICGCGSEPSVAPNDQFMADLARAMTEPIDDADVDTRYTCGFRGPSPELVVIDEVAEFADGSETVCDRCSSDDRVRFLNSCRDCGVVPLCAGCRDAHAEEMCDDDEYEGVLARGTD